MGGAITANILIFGFELPLNLVSKNFLWTFHEFRVEGWCRPAVLPLAAALLHSQRRPAVSPAAATQMCIRLPAGRSALRRPPVPPPAMRRCATSRRACMLRSLSMRRRRVVKKKARE
ncbi:unnamed protein product [Urochloa humidicola]